MKITTHRIKQYNSTFKTVISVDDKPICIVAGVGQTVSNIIAYLNGYDVVIADGKIKKILDTCKTESDGKEPFNPMVEIDLYSVIKQKYIEREVLDKIRAEIEDTGAYEQEVNGKTEFLKGINYCLSIIDKYKAESEG